MLDERLDHRGRAERQGRPARRPHPRDRPLHAARTPTACSDGDDRRRCHPELAARGSSTPSSTPACIDTDDDPTCVDAYDLDCAAGDAERRRRHRPQHHVTAGDNGLGESGSVSGFGGIGLPDNFLEIHVNAVGGPLGDLDAFDTAADDDKTLGIYLDQVAGDLQIGIVHTAGDDSLTTGNVSLRSRAGSILDAQNDAAADVIGQTIDIDAHGGSIGAAANDLEIDSLVGSPFACTNVNCARQRERHIGRRSRRESPTTWRSRPRRHLPDRDRRLPAARARARDAGDIRITVRESADLDEDLYLIRNGTRTLRRGQHDRAGQRRRRPRDDPERHGLRRGRQRRAPGRRRRDPAPEHADPRRTCRSTSAATSATPTRAARSPRPTPSTARR